MAAAYPSASESDTSDADTWDSGSEYDDEWSESSTVSNFSWDMDLWVPSSEDETDIPDIVQSLLTGDLEWDDMSMRKRIDLIEFLIGDEEDMTKKKEVVDKLREDLMKFRYPHRNDTILHRLPPVEIAELLMRHSDRALCESMLNTLDNKERTSLHKACSGGKTALINLILNSAADKDSLVFKVSEKFGSVLHQVNFAGAVSPILEGLKEKSNQKLMFSVNKLGESALHIASLNGNIDVAKVLLQLATEAQVTGKLVNLANADGETALHYAAKNGHELIMDLLLSLDEQVVIKMLTKVSNPPAMINDTRSTGTPLHLASNEAIATKLLGRTRNNLKNNMMYQPNGKGMTALHTAAEKGADCVVSLFLSDVTDKEKLVFSLCDEGNTALHYATDTRIIKLLLDVLNPEQQKKLISSTNLYNETVLHKACARDNTEIVKYLLSC